MIDRIVSVQFTYPVYTNYGYLLNQFKKPKPAEAYSYAKPSGCNLCLTLDFLKYNAMPGELREPLEVPFSLCVDFPKHLPVKVCEDVYQTLWYWKPIGVALVSNRNDLFVKLKEASGVMDELSAKKYKLQKKLAKVERKIEDLTKEVEE